MRDLNLFIARLAITLIMIGLLMRIVLPLL
jgi:hypothetical protein